MAPRRRLGLAGQLSRQLERLATRVRQRVPRHTRPTPDVTTLDDVRRRLELMLVALHGREIRIRDTPAPASSLLDRVKRRLMPRHLRDEPVAFTDGHTVLLPSRLRQQSSKADGLAQYRLLVLMQAERIARGTARVLPSVTQPVERDLFLLREAMAVEARLARDFGNLRGPLTEARRAAVLARPPLGALTATERGIEAIVREALAPHAAAQHVALADSTPADSLQWARTMSGSLRGEYRGLTPVAHWGGVTDQPLDDTATDDAAGNPFAPRGGLLPFEGRTKEREGDGPQSDEASETGEGESTPDAEGPAAPEGAPREASDDAAADGLPSAGDGAASGAGGEGVPQDTHDASPIDPDPGVQYAEWRAIEGRYRPNGVTVRERVATESDDTWAVDTLQRRAPLVRRIRAQFEPLRAQRMRLRQQRDGEELDLQACVQALIDVRSGHTPSERLYMSVRPARRAMTLCLLVDVSGSTEQPLAKGQRIIDVEREAMLLASEAFDELGDDFALLTFSSRGARDVRLATVKDFQERHGPSVRQRIAGLAPGGNTRLGAAVRHATARLVQQPLGKRLLLILSDGRPNDFDEYYADAAVDDSRQAINEARALGVFPFCITIDQDAGPEYLPRIFGANGYTLLREPEQLPVALVRVVRQLLVR